MTTTELLKIHPAPWYVDNDEKGDCCIELAHAVCRIVEAYVKVERIVNWQ